MTKTQLVLVQIVFFVTIAFVQGRQNYHVIYQWNFIEPEWPNPETGEKSLNNGSYIPENNIITGIKLWRDQLYLSVPRLKSGVPATLTMISSIPEQRPIETESGLQNLNIVSPKLKPFPNWRMQRLGDCEALQSVQSMEIDPMGRMWLIDNGRTDIFTNKANNTCPPRLVILDLNAEGTLLKKYIFPKHVADYNSVFLNDIVLDHEHGGFAYITDSGSKDPGLIVYSLATNLSWKIRHETMKNKNDTMNFSNGIDGIALSQSSRYDRMVYYSSTLSLNVYSIPTGVLKSGLTNVNDFVKLVIRKKSPSSGMIMTSSGRLIYGLLANNSVVYLNKFSSNLPQFIVSDLVDNNGNNNEVTILAHDDNILQWPDSFAIDDDNYLWCIANNWQNFLSNNIHLNSTNFRVIKFLFRGRNYQYFDDGSTPIVPLSQFSSSSSSLYGIPVSIRLNDGTFPIVNGDF
ncbi:protein yellow-like [Leptopilina heterotoma]|uniref:protein yellow-like n=1 Tax=Leptopilina heterotoma TaxID=63436 RepID=UPI001CA85D0B|nr:protein yellow-like [Leptopilina heterotoma]